MWVITCRSLSMSRLLTTHGLSISFIDWLSTTLWPSLFPGVLREGHWHLDGCVPSVCVCRPAGVCSSQLCLKATQGVHQAEEKAAAAKNSKCEANTCAQRAALACFRKKRHMQTHWCTVSHIVTDIFTVIMKNAHTHTRVLVNLYHTDLCLLLLCDGVFSGTDITRYSWLSYCVTWGRLAHFSSACFHSERWPCWPFSPLYWTQSQRWTNWILMCFCYFCTETLWSDLKLVRAWTTTW